MNKFLKGNPSFLFHMSNSKKSKEWADADCCNSYTPLRYDVLSLDQLENTFNGPERMYCPP